MYIDSHVHLDDSRFDLDRDNLIRTLKDNKVELVINIGADEDSSERSVELADRYENIYAVVGVHPHSAKDLEGRDLSSIIKMLENDKVVAIGEIGLDYYYDNSPRDIQKKWFKEQINLALRLNKPVVIHSRDADKDTFDIIKSGVEEGGLTGVMHCYSGSVELAKEYLKLGFYISLGGPVTFKNARVPKEVAKEVALDRLLIETDCPYLSPEPYRGKRNEPMFVSYVAEEIAKIKGISIEEVAEVTTKNAKKLFGIK